MFVHFLKYVFFIFVLLFALTKNTLYAQQKNKVNPNGYNTFYYSNGNISSEGNMKNGKPEGYWKTYFESGTIKTEGNRENFLLEGTWIFYRENKTIEKEINYKKKKKEEWSFYYNDSTKLIKKEFYKNDLKDSVTILYYENQKDNRIYKTIPFIKGIEEGSGFEYSLDQKIITIIRYKKGAILSEEKINRYDKNGLKQDVWKEFYENGNLKTEARYIDDKLSGYYKEYTKDGKLLKAVLYIDGEIHEDERLQTLDLRQEFYENGLPKVIGTYNVRGEKHGKFKYFNENGQLEEQIIYNNNVIVAKGKIDEEERKQGYWEEFYPNGAIKSKGKYIDGEKIENWEFFFLSGKKEQEGTYVKGGKQNGTWTWYYETGEILRKEEFRKGLEDGIFIEHFPDGKVITQGEFLEGKKEGFWFYELNDHREEGNYKNGLKDGSWKYFNVLTNKLVFEGTFFEGQENSKFKFYYPSGKLYEEGTYALGKREGIWKRYNEMGEVIITFDYNNNNEIKIDGSTLKFPNHAPE